MDTEILKLYTRLNKHYPIRKIMDYFNILQETGITNMYGGSQFLYMGKKIIEHEYTYKHVPDEEAFEELLEHADDIRQKLIYGAYKQVHEKTDSDDDRFVRGVESQMRKDAQGLLRIWMHFKGNVINEWEEKPGLWSSIKRGANNDDIKNYLFRRIPLDVFKTIVSDNFKWGIKEFEPQYSLYDFHNGVVNIIVEDLINYDYIGDLVSSDFDDNLKEQTYNDIHQFLYDMLFESSEKAYAEAVRQYEEEYGDEIDEDYIKRHITEAIKSISLLNEEREPDMEWDFTNPKDSIDKSLKDVKTKGQAKKYLKILKDKIKNLSLGKKRLIIKLVLIALMGIFSNREVDSIVNDKEGQEITKDIGGGSIDDIKKDINLKPKIRSYSDNLIEFLKDGEGYSDEGYKIGDGKITIGWGHAEDIEDSNYRVGEKITKKEAEELLKQDLESSVNGLNRILNDWDEKGIEVEITQGMYDTMISMIYNMGIGNFRTSDFIQLVKQNKIEDAREEIKNTSKNLFKKYPGLKKRRAKESKLFK